MRQEPHLLSRPAASRLIAAYVGLSVAAGIVAVSAVAICDTCGGGGDRALRIGGIVSVVLALVVATLLGVAANKIAVVSAYVLHVLTLLLAYASAGKGSGSVHISSWLYLLPVVAAITGGCAVARVFESTATSE